MSVLNTLSLFISNLVSTLGAALLLPILIFLFAVIAGVKASKAFRAALYIAIGLTTLWWVLNPFIGQVGQAVSDMVKNTKINLPYVDVGWPFAASVSFSTIIGALIIPIGIGVNLLMLWLKWTDTFDIDLWNFWLWAYVGSMTYYATKNVLYGLLAAIAIEIMSLILADMTAPLIQKFYNLPGLSFPHVNGQGTTFLAIPLNWLLDKIGLNKIQIDAATIRKRFGVLGDSVVMGFILGIFIALLAWGRTKTTTLAGWTSIIGTGIVTAGAIYLFPKVVSALMDGLVPLSEGVREALKRRGVKKELYLGMDAALAVGNETVIAVGLLTIATIIPLTFILPGNRFLPLADLGVHIFFFITVGVAITGGNIIKGYIVSVISTIIGLYTATWTAPMFTKIVVSLGKTLPQGVQGVQAMCLGANPFANFYYFFSRTPLGLVLLFAFDFVILFSFRKNKKLWYKLVGYVENESQRDKG
jgi:PTS system galactitol-specific IIC component